MENTGLQRDRGRLIGRLAGWTRTEWRTLLLALAISLTAHLIVLATSRPKHEGDGRRPVLVVTLTGALVAPRAQQVTAPPSAPPQPPAPAAPSPAPQVLAVPAAKAPAAERKPAITAPPVQPPPAAPEARVTPVPNRAAEEHGTASSEPEQPASPLSSPELGEVARRVSGRRLQATLWIDESGRVTRASVKLNEISGEVASLLQEALLGVRFAPALQDGRPVASELDTRLCFDAAGVLDTTSPECLRPLPPPEGQAEVDAPSR